MSACPLLATVNQTSGTLAEVLQTFTPLSCTTPVQYHLCQHPEAEERVRSELRGLGLLATPGTAPRPVEFEDLSRMPFLSACIKVGLCLVCKQSRHQAFICKAGME